MLILNGENGWKPAAKDLLHTKLVWWEIVAVRPNRASLDTEVAASVEGCNNSNRQKNV